MRRGDIRLVDFEPARGSEADKRRPAVIVSNDGANATAARLGRGVLTVVPVTSNTRQVYPFQVLLPSADTGLQQDSKAQAEQIRSVAIQRIGDQVGRMPPTLMIQLDEALRLHLELLRACHRRYDDMARPTFVETGLRAPRSRPPAVRAIPEAS